MREEIVCSVVSNIHYRAIKWASANSSIKIYTTSGIEMVSPESHCEVDISLANLNQGGKCIFGPDISYLACKMADFTEGSLPFSNAHW